METNISIDFDHKAALRLQPGKRVVGWDNQPGSISHLRLKDGHVFLRGWERFSPLASLLGLFIGGFRFFLAKNREIEIVQADLASLQTTVDKHQKNYQLSLPLADGGAEVHVFVVGTAMAAEVDAILAQAASLKTDDAGLVTV